MTDVFTDLRIQKSADDYTPELGQEVTWTITVSNDGPSWAENVRVDEMLPEGMQFVSGHATTGGFDLSSGLWSIGGMGVGEEATATITMVVTDADNYINNYATVHTDTHDCNPSNDTNTIAVDPWAPTQADLSLVKTVSDPEPEVGSVVEWTVSVANSGPDTAWGTRVNETLPEGLTFLGARASSGVYDFESGVWNVGHLANGETAEMVISTSVDTDGAAQYVNTAVASSNTADANESNNTAQATIAVSEATVVEPADTAKDMDSSGGCAVACCCICYHEKEEVTGADLKIVKFVDNATPNLNSEVVWTLMVTNNGPEDAVNVVVNDNLPGGVDYVSDLASMGAFDDATGVWDIGNLANGESAMLQITTVATDAAAVQTNIALVSSDTEDSDPSNNMGKESIDAVAADLAITKTVDDPAPVLGEEVVWTIDVINNGPDTAENVIIQDALPAGTTFVASSDNRFDAAAGTAALGDLGTGESVSIDITVTVDDADGARINVASVSSDTYDNNLDNNADNAQTDAIAADLAIDKSVDNPEPDLGEEVVWTIVVENKGPDTAENVVVSEALPEGTTFVSSSDTRFDVATSTIALGDMLPGDVVSIDVTVTVEDADGARVNTASVTSDTFDNDTNNNAADAVTDAVAADLAITKTVDDPAPNLGEEVVWTIAVINNGPDTAENVVITDALPAGTTFVASSDDRFDAAAGSIALGDLDSGASVSLDITVTVDDADGARINVASVSSDTFDNNPDNNADNALTDAIAADLVIDKSVDNPEPDLGEDVVWTIVVENKGPDTAENVVVSEALPEGTTFVSSSDARFDVATSTIALGDMLPGDVVSIDVTVTVEDADGARVNTASVTSDTFDNDTTNNTADAVTDAVAADLAIQKTVDNTAPDLGADVVWTIEVVNNGPDTAENVVVSDVLPAGTAFVASSDSRFDPATGMIALGDLPASEMISFDVTVTVTDADGPQTNVASVSSDTFDNDSSNNTDDAVVDAVAADLELTKGVLPDAAAPGDVVEWQISVTNKGPDAASGVEVQDVLPGGVTYFGDSAGGGVPHIAFLGDSWMTGTPLTGAILEPVTQYVEDLAGGVTVDNYSVNGHTATEMLAETNWQPGLTATTADTIFTGFGVNEFIAGVTPADYQASLTALFDTLATVSPASDVVFFIPAETDPSLLPTPATISAPWSDYVAAAVAATDAAGVTAVNLANAIPAYSAGSALWADAAHISEAAASLVTDAVSAGYTLPTTAFDAVSGIWSVGDLAVGETKVLDIEATVVDIGDITNVAQVVASDQVDPDSAVNNDDGDQSEDDEDSALLTVPEIIDLELTQEISATTGDVGDDVTYTITVTNNSTVPASGVSVGSQLPAHFASGDLTFVDSSDADIVLDPASDWIIGDLAPGQTVTLTVDATVSAPGTIDNVAEVITADQVDVDSTPANNDPAEDDQAAVSITVIDPNPVPDAVDDMFSVTSNPQALNAVIMVDHSGSMGTTQAQYPDFFAAAPSFGNDIVLPDGTITSRLELVRGAVEDFAGKEQIAAVKILGFDATAGGAGNVSPWFDVSGASPDTMPVRDFVDDFVASGTTNYIAALQASQDFFEAQADGSLDSVPNSAPVNYYFLTDGDPLGQDASGALVSSVATPGAAQVQAWEDFVDAEYNEAFGVGFGAGVTNFDALDLVSHPDDPALTGAVSSEENTIVTSEADAIPADLFETVAESVTGNVFANDDIGGDGLAVAGSAITSLTVEGTTYSFTGGMVSVTAGSAPATTVVRPDFINTPVTSGGRLEFNFTDGSFEYFAPLTTVAFTESFDYTITDSAGPAGGDSDVATLTIDVTPGTPMAAPTDPTALLLSEDDELFASAAMDTVRLPESAINEWSGDASFYDAELYEMMTLVS